MLNERIIWVLIGMGIVGLLIGIFCFFGVRITPEEERRYKWLLLVEKDNYERAKVIYNQHAARLLVARILDKLQKKI